MQGIPNPTELLVGAMAFLRIGALLFSLPILGDAPTPVRVRVLLSLALTIGMYPAIPATWAPNLAADVLTIASYVIREVGIGLVIGFCARAAFDGIMMAATVVSYQMGFGTASLFLPDYGEKMDSFSAFHRMMVMLIFLTLGLHQIFLSAILDTFRLIPGGAAHMSGSLVAILITVTGGILAIAVQLSAPILVALLFTMAAIGLIARAVPNMNAFLMSFPASFIIGMVIYIATLPFFPSWITDHFTGVQELLHGIIRSIAPSPQP